MAQDDAPPAHLADLIRIAIGRHAAGEDIGVIASTLALEAYERGRQHVRAELLPPKRPSSPAGTWEAPDEDKTPVRDVWAEDRETPDIGTRASRLPTLPPPAPRKPRLT